VLLGRVAAAVGDDRTIITRDKKTLHVKASDILSKTETNAPAAPASPPK
jgi:serine kinase of HPr protein (carbohydrate metabolism regulator)